MQLIGINQPIQFLIIQILAGILYLGQISYIGDDDSSKIDPKVNNEVIKCCKLLGLKDETFRQKITTRSIEVENKEMIVHLSKIQALDGRDALAKEIYHRLFLWLVAIINSSTGASKDINSVCNTPSNRSRSSSIVSTTPYNNNNNNSNNSSNSSKTLNINRVDLRASSSSYLASPLPSTDSHYTPTKRIIALLDIFGFESFQTNRFEQLCINYANEKLQQKFTEDVFRTVQQEYQDEGLEWELIGYKDNADVLELMESKTGRWW